MIKYLTLLICITALSAQLVLAQDLEMNDRNTVRGIVASENVALLSVDVSSKVSGIPFKVGESFKKNQTLLAFDCVVKKAEASAAYASFLGAKAEYKSDLEMQKSNAVGELEVELSKARKDESHAMWVAAKGRTNHCIIKAPFDGKVAALSVNEHEISTPDKPIMKIVGNTELELRLVVPSSWLSWLSTDSQFTFKIDETGDEHKVLVSRIGAEIDAISATIEIYGKFTGGYENVIPGMSGVAHFKNEKTLADTGE